MQKKTGQEDDESLMTPSTDNDDNAKRIRKTYQLSRNRRFFFVYRKFTHVRFVAGCVRARAYTLNSFHDISDDNHRDAGHMIGCPPSGSVKGESPLHLRFRPNVSSHAAVRLCVYSTTTTTRKRAFSAFFLRVRFGGLCLAFTYILIQKIDIFLFLQTGKRSALSLLLLGSSASLNSDTSTGNRKKIVFHASSLGLEKDNFILIIIIFFHIFFIVSLFIFFVVVSFISFHEPRMRIVFSSTVDRLVPPMRTVSPPLPISSSTLSGVPCPYLGPRFLVLFARSSSYSGALPIWTHLRRVSGGIS